MRGLPDHSGEGRSGLQPVFPYTTAPATLESRQDTRKPAKLRRYCAWPGAADQMGGMHLVPDERAHRKTIDDHIVCEAIAGLGDPARIPAWATRFSLLSEPHRLTVLLAVHRAGPIAVTDLATATGINDAAVSQILRLLRTSGTVTADKNGRIVRYRLTDPHIADLLDLTRPAPTAPRSLPEDLAQPTCPAPACPFTLA